MTVDPAVEKSMMDRSHRILMPKIERSLTELDKLLLEPDPTPGLSLLARTRILNFVLPEIAIQVGFDQNSKYHSLELWEHTLRVVSGITRERPEHLRDDFFGMLLAGDQFYTDEEFLDLRWAALLHDIAKPQTQKLNTKTGYYNYVKHDMLGAHMADALCRRLRMSNDRRQRVVALVESHLLDSSPLKAADDAAKGPADS
jgi:putative nucleotidyltransferase with HDIG domain